MRAVHSPPRFEPAESPGSHDLAALLLRAGPIQGVRHLARGEAEPAPTPTPTRPMSHTAARHPARDLLHGEIGELAVRLEKAGSAARIETEWQELRRSAKALSLVPQ